MGMNKLLAGISAGQCSGPMLIVAERSIFAVALMLPASPLVLVDYGDGWRVAAFHRMKEMYVHIMTKVGTLLEGCAEDAPVATMDEAGCICPKAVS